MDRFKLKLDAKSDIRGRLWIAIQPLLVMFIIDCVVSLFSSVANRTDGYDVYVVMTIISTILSIVYGVLYFPLYVGQCRFYMNFTSGRNVSWTIIFDGLKNSRQFGQQFLCHLITGLIIFAGAICLIIPGIYLAMRYSMISYVYAENPDLKWKEAARRSYEIMKGHCFEYFCLILSFFFWWCLCFITFGIAALYVAPYMSCTMARYYKSLAYVHDGYSFTTANGSESPENHDTASDDASPFNDDLDHHSGDGTVYPFDID